MTDNEEKRRERIFFGGTKGNVQYVACSYIKVQHKRAEYIDTHWGVDMITRFILT